MNGEHFTNKRNSSFSFKFLMTVICIIAVIMVTVYFIGAQFRTDAETSGGDTSLADASSSTASTDSVGEAKPEEPSGDAEYNIYIPIEYSLDSQPSEDGADNANGANGADDSDDVCVEAGVDPNANVGVGFLKPTAGYIAEYAPVYVTHEHLWTERTCTEPAYCEICGEEGLPALGHNMSAATCKEPSVCQRCGEVGEKTNDHKWAAATCTEPKTCTVCGATKGEPLGHKWKDATCQSPKTCSRCGETRGDKAAHDYAAATCTKPKTCKTCGATKGEALGHDWRSATCTSPKTCRRCGKTSGSALGHQWQAATKSSPSKCSECGMTKGERLPNPIKVSPFKYTEEEYDLLARLMYVEAGSSSRDAMMAVGAVVMNRVRNSGFGSTVKAVINAPGQFPAKNLYNRKPPSACYEAAKACLEGEIYDRYILYFKMASGGKSWSVRKYQFTVGDNYFYT